MSHSARPLIGVTADLSPADNRLALAATYIDAIAEAGGLPVVLPCRADLAAAYLDHCQGVLLSGGDDPRTEPFGQSTHPKAKLLHPDRQAFELAILRALDDRPLLPALGVCLGMQLMGLHAGGRLDQHLPDALPSADDHWGRREHPISGELGLGVVNSHHRQALADSGAMRVIATAPDGVIEAIQRDDRPFYLGVQWHPERTEDGNLGLGIIRKLVDAARSGAATH